MSIWILIVSLFLSLHLKLPLRFTESAFIPNVAMLIAALAVLPRKPNIYATFLSMAVAGVFVALAILLNVTAATSIAAQVLSGGQLIYSVGIATMIASSQPVTGTQAFKASRICLFLAGAVVVFAALENRTALGAVSDGARSRLFETGLYDADHRDLAIAGFIRPKAFAAEPSHAAWSVCALSLCAVAFSHSFRSIAFGALLSGLAAIVFYSPAAAAACLLFMLLMLHETRKQGSLGAAAVVVFAVVVGAALAVGILTAVLAERLITGSDFGVEGSVFIRVIQPFSLASEALSFNPVVGVGFQGLEEIWTKIQYVEEAITVENLNTVPGMAILTIPLFTGLYGVVAFVLFFTWILHQLPQGARLAFSLVVLFSLIQKQSFVLSTAWLIGAVWFLQSKSQLVDPALRRTMLAHESS